MPIQRRESFGKRFFGGLERGVQSAMPFFLQYLQNLNQQNAPLDLSGVAPPQPVGQAGIGDYDTPLTRNILAQMGFQPQGVDPEAMARTQASQPEPVNVMDQLKEIEKKIQIETAQVKLDKLKAPPPPATSKESDLAEKVFLKRLGQTRETGEIDIESGTITESKVPFGITEAQAAADSVRAMQGQPVPQPQGQAFGGASSYNEVIQWYNSPAGQQHPQRDAILQEAKKRFGVQ